jgi:LuxR family maltose regulon positive regulatory protein
LHDRLDAGRRALLTLVVAPVGWGKTTLIADWLHGDAVAAGWVSLDRGDNDVMRFWRYLLLAVAQAGDGVGSTALKHLDAPGVGAERDVLPVLVNEVAQSPADIVVVLDDYHAVHDPAVHASVVALLDHAPPQLHLILSSRTDPPLALSRLRVDGRLVEIRADHLRFTVDEAADLLTHANHVVLSATDVQRLVARTEGWAAGLRLAALRLADRPDGSSQAEFIDRFTGGDRHVIDYLGEEVLANQPEHLRDFLLHTSLLDRICAGLADAVTGRTDSATMLDEIYRANLFLIPLDGEQRWFRYHQLFRDILKHELARIDPAAMPPLHRRAAEWFAEAGDATAAIEQAIRSKDTQLTARLIVDGWRREFNAGHLTTVQRWLDALPGESIAHNVQLTMARVWLALDSGRLDEAGVALDAIEASIPGDAHVRVLRALLTFKIGDAGAAAGLLENVGGPVADPFLVTVRDLLTGIGALWRGDAATAALALREATATAARNDNRLARIYAMGCLGLLSVERDDLATAELLVGETDAALADAAGDAHFTAMFPTLAAARLALARGDGDAARSAAEKAVELARRGAGRIEEAAALVTAARAARVCGTDDLARRRREEARSVLRECPDPGPVVADWFAVEQRALLAQDGSPEGDELTERERAILALLPGPRTQREIAGELFVTPNTLKTHLRSIYRKLGAASRTEAVSRARTRGLL